MGKINQGVRPNDRRPIVVSIRQTSKSTRIKKNEALKVREIIATERNIKEIVLISYAKAEETNRPKLCQCQIPQPTVEA